MEKITFDSGMKKYEVGNGVLSFNPSDPNVYARFMDATEKLQAVEDSLVSKSRSSDGSGEAVLRFLAEADREAKKILGWVFGEHNDFDRILGGVNLLAVGSNGERVITNFLHALMPIIQSGVEECAKVQTEAAKVQAQENRAKRKG